MSDLLNNTKQADATIEYSPEAISQLYCILVFDLMCGQTDRHEGNYFCTYEDVETPGNPHKRTFIIKSVQGIDNDAAFGTMSAEDLQIDNASAHFHGLSFFSKATKGDMTKGNLTLTFLPEKFYKRLMAFSPYDATLELVDMRSANELRALEKRIIDVKDTVRELVESGTIAIVRDGDEKALQEQYEKMRDIASYDDTVPKDATWNKETANGVLWKYLRRNKELIKRDKKNK